jgi:peptide/nickel transport system ATP-binding protein
VSINNLLEIKELSVDYVMGKISKNALNRVSLSIPSKGYTLGLVGETASGKTTLGSSILRLIDPPGVVSCGQVMYQGKDVMLMTSKELREFRWREISMIYQSAMNSLNPVKSVGDHISEVIRVHTKISQKEAWETTVKLLNQVDIFGRESDFPHEFSGGMRQRVVIAMALALSPKLLIADEPTSALDVVVQQQILDLLKDQVIQRGLSMIFITHEIAILSGLVENVAVMYSAEVVETGPLSKVLFEPLHPYTEHLLESLVTLDTNRELLEKARIRGTLGLTVIRGCRFASRCKYAFDRCRVESPLLKNAGGGRSVACHRYD